MKQIVAESFKRIANRNVLKRHLSEVDFLSNEYQLYKNRLLQDYINLYDQLKASAKGEKIQEQNKTIIERRKAEYRKREGEGKGELQHASKNAPRWKIRNPHSAYSSIEKEKTNIMQHPVTQKPPSVRNNPGEKEGQKAASEQDNRTFF